jgi:putative selenate reductase FAD-binding subunit
MIEEVVRPGTVREAVHAGSRPGAAFLGGGTWLNSGRAPGVTILVSLERLGLDRIDAADGRCRIGASATLQSIVDAAAVPAGLRTAASLTASRTLRNMRTLGGELGLRPVDSAVIPVLIAMDARVLTAAVRRPISVVELLSSGPGPLVLSVEVPTPRRCEVRALSRTSHASRSLVLAASAARAGGDGQPEARVVVTDCLGMRVRLPALEELLVEVLRGLAPLPSRERIEAAARDGFTPAGDPRASAAYKGYLAGVFAADALRALADGEAAG